MDPLTEIAAVVGTAMKGGTTIAAEGAATGAKVAVGGAAETAVGAAQTGVTVAETAAGAAESAGTVAEVARGAGETAATAAETAPDLEAAAKVGELAAGATASPDLKAGENALGELANTPIPDGEVPKAEDISELSAPDEQLASSKSEEKISEWDKAHQKPDEKTQPAEYKKWCEQRWEAEIDAIADAKTDIHMSRWDKAHPEPDKGDKESHDKWEKERADHKETTKKKEKNSAKSLKEGERTMVLSKIEKLRELHEARKTLIDGINALRRKPEGTRTDDDKIRLADWQTRLMDIEGQIKLLESDLVAQSRMSVPMIALLITTALVSMLGYKAYKANQD